MTNIQELTGYSAFKAFRGLSQATVQSDNTSASIMDMAENAASSQENKSALTVTLEDFNEKLNSLNGQDRSNLSKDDTKKGMFTKIGEFLGFSKSDNIFETEQAQKEVEQREYYYQHDIFEGSVKENGGIEYAKSGDDYYQSALNFAKADIEAIEKAYSMVDSEAPVNKKLDYQEIKSYSNTDDETIANMSEVLDLDGKTKNITAEEYATYMILADGLLESEQGLAFSFEKVDGLITPEEANKIYNNENESLKELAKSVYNYYSE